MGREGRERRQKTVRESQAMTDFPPFFTSMCLTHLNLKCEVLLQVLDDHDEKWQLDAESL